MSWVSETVWKCDQCEEIIHVPIGPVADEVMQVADHLCGLKELERELEPHLRKQILEALGEIDSL